MKEIAKLPGNKESPNVIILSLWVGVFISSILYLIEPNRETKYQILFSLQLIFKTFPETIYIIASVSLALNTYQSCLHGNTDMNSFNCHGSASVLQRCVCPVGS